MLSYEYVNNKEKNPFYVDESYPFFNASHFIL